jgi:2-(1,2-epoxy-1,2-dihydrophenyl)acetyl-CoA isomerase
MTGTEDGYSVARNGGVWTFTIEREASRNSLTTAVRTGILTTLMAAEADPDCGALVITGAGDKAFCAGGDVQNQKQTLEGGSAEESMARMRLVGDVVRRIVTSPIVVISAVNGAAFGGGCFMALAADIVVARKGATFGFGFSKRGLVPDWAGFYILPRLVGMARAKSLILRGVTLRAEAAYEMGMIAELVERDPLTLAQSIAQEVASGPRIALGMSKHVLARSFETGLDGMLSYEMLAQAVARTTDDHREGVMSFLEKRPPVFKGR